jgi:hypothetical protein
VEFFAKYDNKTAVGLFTDKQKQSDVTENFKNWQTVLGESSSKVIIAIFAKSNAAKRQAFVLRLARTIPKFQHLDEKKVSDLFVNPNCFQELYPGQTRKFTGVRLSHASQKESPIYIAMHDKEKESNFFQAFATDTETRAKVF